MIRLFATLIILVSSSSYACECSQILSYKEYAAKASMIFRGQLIRAEIIENDDHAAEFTFSIGEAFKGVETGKLTVKQDITSCTLPMNLGRQYLVFTNPGQGINLCSGSADMQRVNFPEIEYLRSE
ncbi:hypothetical protein [Microbulbifer rhizosphaerae]|uniref:Tissue inhibitor of metalloproteinase n=1 Tax=Microbulbifer rhizosphaerae TaxID=1562603 RepID=A0A7W4WG62_9GAMM|nr:hypothetical protein [Microbulbifer rhizosphaerae]MBB3063639.1 hypothetical protein [Microbulbifer rhizosphaerae]